MTPEHLSQYYYDEYGEDVPIPIRTDLISGEIPSGNGTLLISFAKITDIYIIYKESPLQVIALGYLRAISSSYSPLPLPPRSQGRFRLRRYI